MLCIFILGVLRSKTPWLYIDGLVSGASRVRSRADKNALHFYQLYIDCVGVRYGK